MGASCAGDRERGVAAAALKAVQGAAQREATLHETEMTMAREDLACRDEQCRQLTGELDSARGAVEASRAALAAIEEELAATRTRLLRVTVPRPHSITVSALHLCV